MHPHRQHAHAHARPAPPSNLYRQPPLYTPPVFDAEAAAARERDLEERQREQAAWQRDLEERQREQAHYDAALAQSERELADAHARGQSRVAGVATLAQMFPALGDDVVAAVLDASGDDLGAAIDRLLEM